MENGLGPRRAEAVLHVDVVARARHLERGEEERIAALVEAHLRGLAALRPGEALADEELAGAGGELARLVRHVALCEARHEPGAELPRGASLAMHVHALHELPPQPDGAGGAGDEPPACEAWQLPHEEFHGLWESLEFESPLKADALRFAQTALELGERGVDARAVAAGRALLLHGPPGTGKTSLCRALAHKLAVRLRARYPRARLLEINAHALFSKWFSESGKLVTKLFDRIQEVAEDDRMLTCILIDEVESLTHARRAALAGLEPSDSVRAVNAVLGALDRLRRRPNALVLATSNEPRGVDRAFLDRADLKRRVGPPGARAAYSMLRQAAAALARAAMVARERTFPWRMLEQARFAESEGSRASLRLRAVAVDAAAAGLSGRALRRLPFLALALHCAAPEPRPPPLCEFADALHAALRQYLSDEADLRADD